MTEIPIGYPLSPLAQTYIETERTKSVMRHQKLTCSPEKLVQLLTAYNIPVTEHLIDFEKNLGGWVYSDVQSEYGMGIFCAFQQGENSTTIAKNFQKIDWLFNSKRNQINIHGDMLPVWGTGYPRLFFQDRLLIPAGMQGIECLYFLGLKGEIYLYQRELDSLLLVAGSGRTWIEQNALTKYTADLNNWYQIHLCADVAITVANVLRVELYSPCTDNLFQIWANDKIQIRSIPDIAPCIMGTVIATKNPDELLDALQKIQALVPGKPLRLWERANNLFDSAGLSLLSQSGIAFELLNGAAPGHYDRIVDGETGEETYHPSQYDSSTWIYELNQYQ